MTRNEMIKDLGKYFKVSELVCDHTYAKWGEKSWQFLDIELLNVLLVLRTKILCRPLICNKKQAHQRGLRCNLCSLVKDKLSVYLSAHIFGMAIDFDVPGMPAEEVRQLIIKSQNLLPCAIRLEADVSWVHLDVRNYTDQKIVLFKD